MRTTITIDDDLLEAARSLAEAQSVSVGRILSDLARRGLDASERFDRHPETDFPMFKVSPGARPITLEDVLRVEDDD